MTNIENRITMFRGEEYPANYSFREIYETGDIKEWSMIGIAYAFLEDRPSEVLVWSQDQVVSMSKDRYEAGRTPKRIQTV